ncbi:MAG: TolC family protein, partial [Candidatus Aminicenantes bacterium]|nr:TolC family protein [Candidatus Aminicenantes bacterium]
QSLNSWNNDPSQDDPDERVEYRSNFLLPNLNLRWTLFSGFSISITKKKFELLNNLSEGNSAVIVENTIQGIILSYYKVLLEKEKVKVLSELKKLSGDRMNYVNIKKELGAISTYEALQSKIAFLNDSAGLAAQQINYRNAKRSLNLVLGEGTEKEYKPTDQFSVEMENYELSDLRNKMLSNNKTLKNQYINLQILKRDLSLSKSPLFPSVSLNGGINGSRAGFKYSGIPEIVSKSYDYYVNMSINWTLFNGGKVKTAIKNAKISEKIGNLKLDEMKFILDNTLLSLYETYNLRKELLRLADESLKSASLNLKISFDKYKSGSINSFNYRDVQLMYLNAALSKLQAIFNIIDSRSELMRITGGMIDQK